MTRSLSGQHAEESNREETGSWSFANETNGLIVALVKLRRSGKSATASSTPLGVFCVGHSNGLRSNMTSRMFFPRKSLVVTMVEK